MIWIVTEKESYQITGVNIVSKDGVNQLWGTRTNNHGIKILSDPDYEVTKDYKNAIDFAIENNHKIFKIN